jgi:tryptophanyl-tRNA synthetase
VFSLHKVFSPPEEIDQINRDCRKAEIGCVDCKRILAKNLNKHLVPFRSKRADLEKDPEIVKEVLTDGAKRARVIASKTMEEVREAIGFYGSKA